MASHQLFARAGLARDRQRATACGHELDPTNHLTDGTALTDEAIPVKVWADHGWRKRFISTVPHNVHRTPPDFDST
jgi:hypothetical protein